MTGQSWPPFVGYFDVFTFVRIKNLLPGPLLCLNMVKLFLK